MSFNSGSKSALVVENDKATRDSLCQYLTSGGWLCDVVESPEITHPNLSGCGYDLVVIDAAFALPSGIDTLKDIRSSCPRQAILLLTTNPEFERELVRMRDSAVGMLLRPLDSNLIPVVVNRITSAVKIREFEERIQDFIVAEKTTYEFNTAQLSGVRFPLSVLTRLETQGRLNYGDRLRLDLAFQEAIANSVEHGNLELDSVWREQINEQGEDLYSLTKAARLNDPLYSNRKILVTTEVLASHIEIRIRDQGKGFNTSKLEPLQSSLESCFGRGIALIKSAVDRLWFESSGREVVMVKGLSAVKPRSGF